MLTNPTTSSTSGLPSSSLVEATSLLSPTPPATGLALTPSASGQQIADPNLQNSVEPNSPSKRKKKSAKANAVDNPLAEVGSSTSATTTTPSSKATNDNAKKRSRKQKIDVRGDEFEVSVVTPEKTTKRRKSSAAAGKNKVSSDCLTTPIISTKKGNSRNVNKNSAPPARRNSANVLKKGRKNSSASEGSVVSTYDPQQKIVLRKSEFIDPNLCFTIFPDLSRGLGAIGPSEVILAVESLREPGTQDELLTDSGVDLKSTKIVNCQFKVLSLFLSVPHFLPLKSVYSAGEPFSRILRYNALEQYTKGELGKGQVSSFRFYGPRYEKQVPTLSPAQEKDSRVVEIRKRIPNPNAYLESTLIIKHPILGFYSKKLVTLQFIVLKKICLPDANNTVVGHLKAKVVQLKRSQDLRNIEIYVDETRVPEAASDVNAMNQQNVQPVIQSASGLIPLIARTSYQQPEYQIQQPQPQAETQFQYVQYHYQNPSELVHEISGGGNLLTFDLPTTCGEYYTGTPTFRDETGAQVVILAPGTELQSASSFNVQQQSSQQVVHQQPEATNFYSGQESVIIQPHQHFGTANQQAYTIQQPQQSQQIIIQPQERSTKEGTKYIYFTGNPPIQLEFQPTPQSPEQTTSYTQQQQHQQPEPLIQLQPSYSSKPAGQQIIIQQSQPNQNQYQVQQQQQVVNSHSPVRHHQGQQQQNLQFTQQSGNSTPSQRTYQYQNVTQQGVVQQVVQHSHQQQQHPIHQGILNQSQQATQTQVKYQTLQQQQQQQQQQSLQSQPLQSTSVVHNRPPPVVQQQTTSSLQSPPVPGAQVVYQQNQSIQHNSSQVQAQVSQPQFVQNRTPLTSSGQQQQQLHPQPLLAKEKIPKVKQSKAKKNAKPINPEPILSPQQLEQLRQREQKSNVPAFSSPQTTSPVHPGSVRPGFGPHSLSPLQHSSGVSSFSGPPPIAGPLRPVISPQQTPVVRYPPSSSPSKGRVRASAGTPVISSTTSLARFPGVSSGTSTPGQLAAPKSQITSASPTPHSLSTTAPHPSTTTPVKKPKTFYVVAPPPTTTASPGAPPPAPAKPEFQSKPGHLAVCPHCGVGNRNILRCNRCKHELPADVKFIKDEWSVNQGGAAVAIPAPKTTSATTSTPTTTNTTASSENKITVASGPPKAKPVTTGRKILLVNKPPPPTTQGTSVVVNKSVIAPGTVQVQIQPDGGSAVTINSGSVVQTKTVLAKAPVKRRAPARKRQAHECITLSSDEEEPEPPKPKAAKQEEKSAETTASSLVAAAKNPTSSATSSTTAASGSSTVVTSTTLVASASKTVTSSTISATNIADTSAVVKQGELVKQDIIVTVKKEEKTDTFSNIVNNTSPAPAVSMPKQFNINLSVGVKDSVKDEKVNDPIAVLAEMDRKMGDIATKFQYATLTARSVRVGSYKVTTADTQIPIPVQLTELGIKFSLPAANYKVKNIKLCIPMESILQMRAHFAKRLQVIFITTGPKYACWIREALELDGNPQKETSNYYCPMNGLPSQQTITILLDNVSDMDTGIIKKLYSNVLTELEYHQANELLMKITPQSFKSSIGISSSSNSASPEPSTGLKIVSTASIAKPEIPSPPESNVSGVSTATTVIVQRSECPTPIANNQTQAATSTGTGETNNVDLDKAILFYEGRNNVKVPISPNDINCLGYSQFLNDQIIDFWLAVIQSEKLSEEDRNRTFVFDSFFYSKLTEKMKRKQEEDGNMTAGERRHLRVKKRTKNVDIFSKDFLVVPINENFHWFIAIICFPGMEGYHDYATLEPLPNYKRPRTVASKSGGSSTTNNNKKKPVVYNQPKNDTTAAYSARDEAPEDPEEMDQISSPDTPVTPGTDGIESKSQGKTEIGESNSTDKGPSTSAATGTKRKSEFGHAVKHPCILIFDSLAGDARGRIYSTLREYLRIEYKTKKRSDRVFDKTTMPGVMPKVPQQPNFSDCGLYMLQYVESFFTNPIPSYEPKDINLKQWFPSSIAENKRREIYDFIKERVTEKNPLNVSRIPEVNFEPDENDLKREQEAREEALRYGDGLDSDYDDSEYEETDEELFQPASSSSSSSKTKNPNNNRQQRSKRGSDSDDHNYATTPPTPKVNSAAALAASMPTVMVAITPLPATSDTTQKKNT